MRKYSSLVILDTKDKILENIEQCDLIKFRGREFNHKHINLINIDLFNENFYLIKKRIYKKTRIFEKVKKNFSEVDMHNLEIFNLRNDKENLYNKIFILIW